MRILVITLISLLVGGSLPAQDTPIPTPASDAPTFLGVYGWKQAIWQYTVVNDELSLEKGDVWGGRIVGGLGIGRFGLEMRGDVSGLKEQFSFEDPKTFNTLEVFGAAHYVVFVEQGMQIGPVIAVGNIADEQSKGIHLNMKALGIRIGGHGSELHILVGQHNYLPDSDAWRFSFSGHLPIKLVKRLYAVWDLVTGDDGYARAGIAVRLK